MARVPLTTTVRNRQGRVVAGARLFVYEVGTTTEVDLWNARVGGSQIPQPLEANAEGRFPNVYAEAGELELFSPDDNFFPNQEWEAASALGPVQDLPADVARTPIEEADLDTALADTINSAAQAPLPLSDLAQSSATNGQIIAWNGSAWVPTDGGGIGAHASTHEPGGADAMAVDADAGTGSLRTLGTGEAQAAAGNDARLSDARAPTAHTHPLADLTQSGAGTGQVATWNGSAWAPASPSGGGGDGDLPYVNLESEGALGNDSADNSTTIQAALDALPVGGVAYLPDGIYRVSGLTLPADRTLRGTGTLKLVNGTNTRIVSLAARSKLKDVKLDGNGANQSSTHTLVPVNGAEAVVSGVEITNAKHKQIQVGPLAFGAVVESCNLHDNGGLNNCNGIELRASYSRAINNRLVDIGNGWGIRVGHLTGDPGDEVKAVHVVGNTLKNIDHGAAGTELNSQQCLFQGNTVENCAGLISAKTGSHHTVDSNLMIGGPLISPTAGNMTSSNLTFSNNTIRNVSTTDYHAGGGSTLIGNTFISCTGPLRAVSGLIADNTFISHLNNAIRLTDSGVISGNRIANWRQSGSGTHSIIFAGTSAAPGVTCANNQIVGVPQTSGASEIRVINFRAVLGTVTGNVLTSIFSPTSRGVFVASGSNRCVVTSNVVDRATEPINNSGALTLIANNITT